MKTHQTTIGKTDEWMTPPEIIKALGGYRNFDLDPAGPPAKSVTLSTAKYENSHLSPAGTCGLKMKWYGRVWLNPPFNRRERPLWMAKMAEHNNGVMLVPAACETDAFYKHVWGKASGILFLKGRPHFYYINGDRAKANSGCTICLVSYGEDNYELLSKSSLGVAIRLGPTCQ